MEVLKTEERVLEIERGNTRSHCVENWLWKTVWTCRQDRLRDDVEVDDGDDDDDDDDDEILKLQLHWSPCEWHQDIFGNNGTPLHILNLDTRGLNGHLRVPAVFTPETRPTGPS